jgi:hypothetical protein
LFLKIIIRSGMLCILLLLVFLMSCQQTPPQTITETTTSITTITKSITATTKVFLPATSTVTSTTMTTLTTTATATVTATVIPGTPSAPVPVYKDPGTGGIIGKMFFPDQMPAVKAVAYIFKAGETKSFAASYVDPNGYYIVNNVPAGEYSIFTSSESGSYSFIGAPAAKIAVAANTITAVDTLTVPRPIKIQLDNPATASMPSKPSTKKFIINGINPKFIWSNLPAASYYVVNIWSVPSASFPTREYDKSETVTESSITWPFDLGSLPYSEFRIDVRAYMSNKTLLGSGFELFTVNTPPAGWVIN